MKLILSIAIAAALVIPARAEDAPKPAPAKSGWAAFLKNIRDGLSQSAVSGERKKGRAVAAVRGKKQKNMADPNEPSLKGDKSSAKAKTEAQYDAELEVSVALLEKGELEKGLEGIEKFKIAHPKHRMDDVEKLIEGAKAAIAEKGAAK